jgi:hypothetical protein
MLCSLGNHEEDKTITHIMHTNNRSDYIHARRLDECIAEKRIKEFLRHSEDRWVDIARDPIRGTGEVTYGGPERRVSQCVPLGIASIRERSDRVIQVTDGTKPE